MTEDRIATLHPDPNKQGVSIDKVKYDAVSAAILDSIREDPGLTFEELLVTIEDRLKASFEGSIGWYTVTVKLDLEARGLIAREGKSPQRLHLVA